MATLIPSLGSCVRRMQPGERRLAERLEAKLEDDYLLWYDVPIAGSGRRPDFVVFHPRRGVLVLEVKDFRPDTIESVTPDTFTIRGDRGPTNVKNPYRQACEYAEGIADVLQKDRALLSPEGHRYAGKLCFPWGFGVVLPNITRRQLEKAELDRVIPPDRVICKDEMLESVDAEEFQERLWRMFPWVPRQPISLPQIDRVRGRLYPELVIGQQGELFADDEPSMPDVIRIMDLQQEQLARSLGEGHRVIHGVAGSGKTMILGYRCLHLARATKKPILVLCYNLTLAAQLTEMLREKGAGSQVVVRSFHRWCSEQLDAFHVAKPRGEGEQFFEAMVQAVIRGVDRGQIPAGQYGAILIDEGHDFKPHWFKLVSQMVNSETNSLLVLYDDAQSIYGDRRGGRFSFKSVGIQAQGRTTILRLNYRNTAEVLRTAYRFAKDIFDGRHADEDGVPLVEPESANRHGPDPVLVRLPSLPREAAYIAGRMADLHDEGTPFREMAVVFRSGFIGEKVAEALALRGIPFEWLGKRRREQRGSSDGINLVTMHSSKGLEFPVVAIPGFGFVPREQRDLEAEVRLTYVGMTRAMDHLVMTYSKETPLTARLEGAMRPAVPAA